MTACVVIGLLATPASGADSSMPAALTTAPEQARATKGAMEVATGWVETGALAPTSERGPHRAVSTASSTERAVMGMDAHAPRSDSHSNPLSLRIATSGVRDGGVRAARVSPSALSGGVSERPSNHSLVVSREVLGEVGEVDAKGRSETCSAHKAVRWYSRRLNDWRGKMGAAVPSRKALQAAVYGDRPGRCPRYLAHLLKRKSYAARLAFGRWHAYNYDWQAWLPDKWQRIGACETGYGRRPGNWRHSNSSYEGAFGFAVGSWDAFTPYADRKAGPYPRNAYLATPRQQYEVALAIQRRYGLSGWGCRNA